MVQEYLKDFRVILTRCGCKGHSASMSGRSVDISTAVKENWHKLHVVLVHRFLKCCRGTLIGIRSRHYRSVDLRSLAQEELRNPDVSMACCDL
jgi:hypothetical protein